MICLKTKRFSWLIPILLLIAAALAVGLYFLLQNTDFSFLKQTQAAADPPSEAVIESLPPEETEPPYVPDTFVISMIGDCTLSSSQYNSDYEDVLAKHDLAWPFSGTRDYFVQDEFTLANLECSFSDTALTSSSLFAFRGPAANAAILSQGGVDCVTLGNNHTNDFGAQGLTDTQAALDAVGVEWVGPGDSRLYETEHGLKVGVYCPGWTGLSESNIQNGIAALQSAGADVCIFAPHWGNEGSYVVSDNQIAYAHIAVDAGAQIVCGTHPHVLQRIEEYNGGYIFYSLGNWSFGGNTAPRDRDTAIAQITVKLQKDGSYVIKGYEVIPCCLSSTDAINDYRPVPYEKGTAEYDRAITKLDGSFNGPDLTVDYSFVNN